VKLKKALKHYILIFNRLDKEVPLCKIKKALYKTSMDLSNGINLILTLKAMAILLKKAKAFIILIFKNKAYYKIMETLYCKKIKQFKKTKF